MITKSKQHFKFAAYWLISSTRLTYGCTYQAKKFQTLLPCCQRMEMSIHFCKKKKDTTITLGKVSTLSEGPVHTSI